MLVQYGALRRQLSQSRGRSNVPFGSGDRRRFLAAEQSGISAARHIFRLQGVYDYVHDAIGWSCWGERLDFTSSLQCEKAAAGEFLRRRVVRLVRPIRCQRSSLL